MSLGKATVGDIIQFVEMQPLAGLLAFVVESDTERGKLVVAVPIYEGNEQFDKMNELEIDDSLAVYNVVGRAGLFPEKKENGHYEFHRNRE